MAREVSYETQVQDDGRWIIDSVHARKNAALSSAQALVGANRHDAVRVLEETGGRREKSSSSKSVGAAPSHRWASRRSNARRGAKRATIFTASNRERRRAACSAAISITRS